MYIVNKRRQAGFTLIELMIVVAIISLLMAIAVPSYQSYVRRGNAAQAKEFLLDIANRQGQYILDARQYAGSLATLGMAGSVPDRVSDNYNITITGAPTTFTVTATPIAGSQQDGEATLSVDYQGTKSPADEWN